MRRLAILFAIAGCADGKSVLHVSVTADPEIADVIRLQLHLTDRRRSRNADVTVTPPSVLATIPPAYDFSLVFPPEVNGEVDVAVDAVGDSGILASGANSVVVTPSRSLSLQVQLGNGGADGGLDLAVGDAESDLATSGGDGGGVVRTPVRVDRQARKMDILFLIDDSPSMQPKQTTLKASLPLITDSIKALPGNGKPVSFHIGVITSDLGANTFVNPQCKTGGRKAILQAVGQAGLAAGDCAAPLNVPFIELDQETSSDNLPQAIPDGGVDASADGPKQTLEKTVGCMISVGEQGCGFEQSLEAIYKALHDPIPENAGFLRPDALLTIVLLSDEDDCSAPDTSPIFDPTNVVDLGQLASYRCSRFGVACGSPPQLMPYGPSDGGLTMCQSATAANGGLLFELDRYSNFLSRPLLAGGLKANPAEISFSAIVGPTVPVESVIGNPTMPGPNGYFVPSLCTPGSVNCTVLLQHSCVAAGNTSINGDPAVRITQLANALPSHQVTNVCNADFTTAARGIGDRITAQFDPACLPGPLANPSQPDCIVTDVKIDGSNTETAVPKCGAGVPQPCWSLVTNAACPGQLDSLGQMEQLVLQVDRGGQPTPADVVPAASCVLSR